MIFLRILSNDGIHLDGAIDLARRDPVIGLDLALYERDSFSSEHKIAMAGLHDSKRFMHLNHYMYWGEALAESISPAVMHSFSHDMDFANRLNISRGVLHWQNGKLRGIPGRRQMMLVLSLIQERGMLPYLENLMLSFDEHRQLIEAAIDSEQKFGVCWDIGHAKIWGGAPFELWHKWLHDLHAHGVPLAFHIHGNHGKHDDHKPLWLHEDFLRGGILRSDTGEILRQLMTDFPMAIFVMESAARYAQSTVDWLEKEFPGEIQVMRDLCLSHQKPADA